jgi:hypothetical protein
LGLEAEDGDDGADVGEDNGEQSVDDGQEAVDVALLDGDASRGGQGVDNGGEVEVDALDEVEDLGVGLRLGGLARLDLLEDGVYGS